MKLTNVVFMILEMAPSAVAIVALLRNRWNTQVKSKMLASPYFLMSAGIVLILIAMFWGSLSGGNSTFIDPRMSDEDIEKELNKNEGDPIPGIIFMIGSAAVGVSIIWRIVRIFV